MDAVLSFLRRLSHPDDAGQLSDGQLLERFVRRGDAPAFETLMHRHGPLVLGVCRSVLRHEQDAEDAFQATFLVLVRRAHTIGKRESVGSWLYGVAFRIAVRARAAADRRRHQEQRGVDMIAAESPPATDRHEMGLLLHDEVQRLPEKYRSPIVLCYLQGKTRDEAARELGWTPGTVKGRLERGRDLLRGRLSRRGLALSSAAVITLLSQSATSLAVPAPLLEATLSAAGGGSLAADVAALTEGMLQTMFWTRSTTVASAILAVVVASAATGAVVRQLLPEAQLAAPATKPVATPAPVAPPANDDIRQAITKGIDYLKKRQLDGKWEDPLPGYEGGGTSLALLALLEAGVKTDEAAAEKALAYLRRLAPRQTYVVSLQTLVLCRVDPRKDAGRIQRNVDWLLRARVTKGNQLVGWSYTQQATGGQADSSNTQYAVLTLHAASEAGAQVDEAVWREIYEYYLRTQLPDGGWSYAPVRGASSSFSMTCAGVSGLLLAGQHRKEPVKGHELALAKGLDFLGERFTADGKAHLLADLRGIRLVGQLARKPVLVDKVNNREHDWYREGARVLLREQAADGSWKPHGYEKDPMIATSFALLFLAGSR